MELGATVCVPNGDPHCGVCPVSGICLAHREGRETELPVAGEKKARRIEERTVLLVRDGERTGIRKRPDRGLLAGLYEFPNVKGYLTEKEASDHLRAYGYEILMIREIGQAKHVFSHIEWHMKGFEIRVSTPARGGRLMFLPD